MTEDLISRSAMKKALLERSFYPAIVKATLENAPAVDAVQVIRCRECKHGRPDVIDKDVIHCIARQNINTVKPDDFCNLGERDGANTRDEEGK